MTYTVTELVTNAFYKSGVVGKEFQEISGSQLNDGIEMLNDLLADKTADKGGIPYFLEYNGVMVPGQEAYPIPNLIQIETLTFFIVDQSGNQVRYGVRKVDRKTYWNTPRANNIDSLPFQYYMERNFGGATVYFYFYPNQAYPFQMWALFSLANVVPGQDLDLTIDKFYQNYLKYLLAVRICNEYDFSVPPGVQRQLDSYDLIIDKREQRIDLYNTIISPLQTSGDGINYAWANLGTGWYPN
jgi:hypothetical protein